jgi:hypothetical protein
MPTLGQIARDVVAALEWTQHEAFTWTIATATRQRWVLPGSGSDAAVSDEAAASLLDLARRTQPPLSRGTHGATGTSHAKTTPLGADGTTMSLSEMWREAARQSAEEHGEPSASSVD